MLRFLIILVFLSILMSLGVAFLDFELSHKNYWEYHGIFLLISLSFFPRLALLFSSIPFGGFFWWLGFIFCPRYLIAVLATLNYWSQNPILVSLSWLIALGGESTEKYYMQRRVKVYRYEKQKDSDQVIDVEAEEIK